MLGPNDINHLIGNYYGIVVILVKLVRLYAQIGDNYAHSGANYAHIGINYAHIGINYAHIGVNCAHKSFILLGQGQGPSLIKAKTLKASKNVATPRR